LENADEIVEHVTWSSGQLSEAKMDTRIWVPNSMLQLI